MTERLRGTRRAVRILNWLRRWALPVSVGGWAASILVALASVAWTGSAFVENIAANFIADITVALLAFALADVLFGLRRSHRQQMEAREKALHVLKIELERNEAEFRSLLNAAMQGGFILRSWLSHLGEISPSHPRVETESWQLLIQSPLLANLPTDLVWSIQESYSVSDKALRNLAYREKAASSERDWDELVEMCVPEFEEARRLTRDALAKLEGGFAD